MPRRRHPARPLGAITLMLSIGLMLALGAVSGPRAAVAPGHRPAASAMPPGGPLPDSVLARVGATRRITVAMFRRAWKQVQDPQHPDSLTPQAARRFLELMISKEALGARALAAGYPWTRGDSLGFRAFQDQVAIKAVLDSALAETARRRQAAGQPELGRMDLGVAARESAAVGLDVRYDPLLSARLALAWKALPVPPSDSSMGAQMRMRSTMPQVAAADTELALAHSSIGDYKVAELLAQWRWLDPWTRPHIETPDAIQELARNGLFERLLRLEASQRRLDQRPDLATIIETRREYTAVTQYVSREVYAKIHPDSLAMTRWYRSHNAMYRIPERARVAHWVLPDQAAAGRLAAMLRDGAAAESLIVQGLRRGADFREEITAASDSALFHEAWRLGVGTVVGPDTVADGWRVARVMSLVEARVRGFDEARPFIVKDMTDTLGEQGLRALVQRVRHETPTRVNTRALEQLTAAH